jgi:hypothetical protein
VRRARGRRISNVIGGQGYGGSSWSVARLSIQASTSCDDTRCPAAADASASATISVSKVS